MPIDFYYLPASGPCRTVLLAAKIIGVELNPKLTDLRQGEHLTPEFLKLNPQHSIPTISDNGFALWESRAIITYLQNQYGKNESLYPKDPKKRAVIDQRLYFDIGTLYSRFVEYYFPSITSGASLDPAKLEKLNDTFKILDNFLANSKYVAGDNLTLADIALVSTVSTIDVLEYDITPYKNVTKWYANIKVTVPGYEEIITKNLVFFKKMVEELRNKK